MIIAACSVQIEIYAVASLKDKRSVIKSITRRLPKQFDVVVAEVAYLDVWNASVLGIVTVGNDAGYMRGRLEKAVEWIEKNRSDVVIVDYSIEFR